MDGNFWGSLLKQVGEGTYKKDKQERKDSEAEMAYKNAMLKYYQDQLTLEREKEAFDQKLQLHKLDLDALKRGVGMGGSEQPMSGGSEKYGSAFDLDVIGKRGGVDDTKLSLIKKKAQAIIAKPSPTIADINFLESAREAYASTPLSGAGTFEDWLSTDTISAPQIKTSLDKQIKTIENARKYSSPDNMMREKEESMAANVVSEGKKKGITDPAGLNKLAREMYGINEDWF